MNILICTYSITRTAGGVFDAVKDLFTNKTFHKHNLKIMMKIFHHGKIFPYNYLKLVLCYIHVK